MHVKILITGHSDIDRYAGQIGTVVKTEAQALVELGQSAVASLY